MSQDDVIAIKRDDKMQIHQYGLAKVHKYVHTSHVHVYLRTYVHVRMYVCVYIHSYVYILYYLCICMYMYVCMCNCVYIYN